MTEIGLRVTQAQLHAKRGVKWSRYPADVIPAWIADMDFPVAPEIRSALRAVIDADDFGYTPHTLNDRTANAYCAWMTARHGWTPDPARIFVGSTMMQLMHAMVMMFSEPGDGVIVQTPIYPGFLSVVAQNNRRLDENPLRRGNARYEMDLDGLRRTIDKRTRILLLCNPHNPTGRVFDGDELRAIADVALERNLIVIANEVHMDLVYAPARHTPFASLGAEIAARTITLSSTSKAMNIAGLRCAVAHFGSAELKARFEQINTHIMGTPSIFSIAGSEAAWLHGGPTLDRVLSQLDANRHRVADFVGNNMSGVTHISPEATYLAWLDCSELNLQGTAAKFFLENARVALSPGGDFSSYTDNFARLNFATSPEILDEILQRMARALKG
ncbi:MAG: MalY/PatB family protein [Alphaproteobacteria bacterium]